MTHPIPSDSPITSNDAARTLWKSLLPYLEPRPRSLYMIFLDPNGRPLKQLVPIDDLPLEPDAEFVGALARIVHGVTEDGPATFVLLALSRAGAGAVCQRDRAWAAMLHEHLGERMSGRPVMLVSAGGVRAIRAQEWEPSRFRYVQRRSAHGYERPGVRRR